jgi:S-adenosylmethionine hydrolase
VSPARPIITLTTDFGPSDSYVAQMKGAVLAINPEATIVDVSHGLSAQAIASLLYVTQTAWAAFPRGAIHVCVIDPGVGGERQALAIETEAACYIGPDNGVLSSALPDDARPVDGAGRAPLPDGIRAFAITNERFLRAPVSATFHGRDVFAPAAAHLSLGISPSELGEPVTEMLAHPALRARRDENGPLRARVVHVDHFGNVITDARAADLPATFTATLRGRRRVSGPVTTYEGAPGLTAIVGSSGYLEIALPNGNAARELNARIGDAVEIQEAD